MMFAHTALELHGDALRIVAVADTHSRPHAELDRRIADAAPNHIVHAGDIGNLAVLRGLEKRAPVLAVRGNIDERASDLPDVMTIDVRDGASSLVKILLVHIAVSGTKLRADIARTAQREGAALVVCGHSHIPFATQDRGVTVFNPGSVGPRRFQLPIVLGVIDIARTGIAIRHVDCETGNTWSPPKVTREK